MHFHNLERCVIITQIDMIISVADKALGLSSNLQKLCPSAMFIYMASEITLDRHQKRLVPFRFLSNYNYD